MQNLSRGLTKRFLSMSSVNVPSVVQVISVDAMNTILTVREAPPTVYARYARHHGIQVDEPNLHSAFKSTIKELSKSKPCFAHGQEGSFEWWKKVILTSVQKACETPIETEKSDVLAKELFEYYSDVDAWMLVDPEIKSSLARIRRKGIPLVVISNFDSRLKILLQELDMLPLFDMVVLSGELGVEKPDPRIFDVVLRHFHLDNPSNILHIGDHKEKDFFAAKKFGAKAILFDPYDQAKDVPRHDRILKFEELNVY